MTHTLIAREFEGKLWVSAEHYMRDSELVRRATAAVERIKLTDWMIERGYATGHGDSIEALLKELAWQIDERIAAEREACARVCEDDAFVDQWKGLAEAAKRIRARGQQ